MILHVLKVFFFVWVLEIPNVYSSEHYKEYKPVFAKLRVFPDAKRDAIVDFIMQAKESILIAAYKLSDPSIIQVLKEAAQRGVRVKVLFESSVYKHNRQEVHESQLQILEGNDFIELYPRSSEAFKQVHHKLIIIDGKKSLIGTINFDAESFDGIQGKDSSLEEVPTRDFALETEDREVIEELIRVFEADIKGQAASYAHPNLVWGPHFQRAKLKHLIEGAQKTLDFYQQDIQDADLMNTVIEAVKRGVKVRLIMMPYPFDKTHQKDGNIPHQNDLIKAGGNVGLYPKDLYIHAKALLIDGEEPHGKLCITSTNFYPSSLNENRELGLIVTKDASPKAVEDFKKVFSQDWKRCEKNVLRK